MQARLQAIRSTGIHPQEYIKQLCQKVERQITLKQAWQTVKNYPFSSMAMIGKVRQAILADTFKQRDLCEGDPDIYFDAFLSITEVLLDEGAYRASYANLKKTQNFRGLCLQQSYSKRKCRSRQRWLSSFL